MVEELRVAVLGYGLAGRYFHARLIGAVPGLRITAVVTRSSERAAQARADLPGVEVVDRAESIWTSAESYDALVVATPNRTHACLATAATEAVLRWFVNKPLAVTSADAEPVVRLAQQRGVLLTTYQ